MTDCVECRRCGELCYVDGEFPKFFAWCEKCKDYADYDMSKYTADWLASATDKEYDRRKYD